MAAVEGNYSVVAAAADKHSRAAAVPEKDCFFDKIQLSQAVIVQEEEVQGSGWALPRRP